MAWAFSRNDVQMITAVAAVHPDPLLWWQTVLADSNDANLTALANEIIGVLQAGGPTTLGTLQDLVEEVRRVADTEAEMELVRIDTDGNGESVEFQAKARGFIG